MFGLFYKWDGCQLMITNFKDLFNKLDAHFNSTPDEDIIFIQEVNGVPIAHDPVSMMKVEPAATNGEVMNYDQLLDESDNEEEPQVPAVVVAKRPLDTLEEMASKRAKLQNDLRILDAQYAIQQKIEEETKKLDTYVQLADQSKAVIAQLKLDKDNVQ